LPPIVTQHAVNDFSTSIKMSDLIRNGSPSLVADYLKHLGRDMKSSVMPESIVNKYAGNLTYVDDGDINWGFHAETTVKDANTGIEYKVIYGHLRREGEAWNFYSNNKGKGNSANYGFIEGGYDIGIMGNTGNVDPKPSTLNPNAGTHLDVSIYYLIKNNRGKWETRFLKPTLY